MRGEGEGGGRVVKRRGTVSCVYTVSKQSNMLAT